MKNKSVCRVQCAGPEQVRACSWALYRRPGSPFWWVRCYVAGELGKDRRWSTGIRSDQSRSVAEWAVADLLKDALPEKKPRRRLLAPRTIYFVKAAGMIKVGITGRLTLRLSKIKCDSPVPIELIGSRPGGLGEERRLHRLFAAQHSHGEWFHASAELEEEAKKSY